MSSEVTKPSRLPEYKLKALDKVTSQKSEVGAGWLNPDGSISIKLNLCVCLWQQANLVLTLFPNDRARSTPQ